MDDARGEIRLEDLIEGRCYGACCAHIAGLDPAQRATLLGELLEERLERKCYDIVDIYSSTHGDWSQTLHIMLFRVLGGSHNRTAAEHLARMVSYNTIMRENSSLKNLEALLLGSSGLLDLYSDDNYVASLRAEFYHLSAKYNITPMFPSQWQLSGMYLHNHPTLRVAQIAACLHDNKISMHSVNSCKTFRDVRQLFSSKASSYWTMNFLPGSDTSSVTQRIGNFKSDILGINLIVPMMLAYGTYIESNELVLQAHELLESIPSEVNHITKQWTTHIPAFKRASESQAIIQLHKEYCERERCNECPLGNILTNRTKRKR